MGDSFPSWYYGDPNVIAGGGRVGPSQAVLDFFNNQSSGPGAFPELPFVGTLIPGQSIPTQGMRFLDFLSPYYDTVGGFSSLPAGVWSEEAMATAPWRSIIGNDPEIWAARYGALIDPETNERALGLGSLGYYPQWTTAENINSDRRGELEGEITGTEAWYLPTEAPAFLNSAYADQVFDSVAQHYPGVFAPGGSVPISDIAGNESSFTGLSGTGLNLGNPAYGADETDAYRTVEAWRAAAEAARGAGINVRLDPLSSGGFSPDEGASVITGTTSNPVSTSMWAQIFGGGDASIEPLLWNPDAPVRDRISGIMSGATVGSYNFGPSGPFPVDPVPSGGDVAIPWPERYPFNAPGGQPPADDIWGIEEFYGQITDISVRAYDEIYNQGIFPLGFTASKHVDYSVPGLEEGWFLGQGVVTDADGNAVMGPDGLPLREGYDPAPHPASGKPINQLTESELADLNAIIGVPGTTSTGGSYYDETGTYTGMDIADIPILGGLGPGVTSGSSVPAPSTSHPTLAMMYEVADLNNQRLAALNVAPVPYGGFDPVIDRESDPLGYRSSPLGDLRLTAEELGITQDELGAARAAAQRPGVSVSEEAGVPTQFSYVGTPGPLTGSVQLAPFSGFLQDPSVNWGGMSTDPLSNWNLAGFPGTFGSGSIPTLGPMQLGDLSSYLTSGTPLGPWYDAHRPSGLPPGRGEWAPFVPPRPRYFDPVTEINEIVSLRPGPSTGFNPGIAGGLEGIVLTSGGSDFPFGFKDGGNVGDSPEYSSGEPSSDLIDMTVSALSGEIRNPDKVVAEFIAKYGEEALSALVEDIISGGDGSFLRGPGDGRADDVPGLIDGTEPVNLSSGEYVVPADVVKDIGGGSTDSGAASLMAAVDEIRRANNGREGMPQLA